MTTPILPTKAVLSATTFTPAQLNYDREVEQFLSVTNKCDFVIQLMTAYRSGLPSTVNINGSNCSTNATSFVYFSDASTITQLLSYLTDTKYGYSYTVTMPSNQDATQFTTASGSGFAVTSGPNSGKSCIIVSWA
jgi:hypothetical protein